MAEIEIVIGTKTYSSWSLRGWLALKATGVAFEEVLIPLRRPDTAAAIRRHSPSGRVPLLKHKGMLVWETLAIGEFLAEAYPAARLWPEEASARALARAISAEMHAGFAALRNNMPMDLRGSFPGRGLSEEVAADIARVTAIWRGCRAKHGASGPYLFGHFTVADAMFAPVVSRFVTYDVALDPLSAAYRDAVWSMPAMLEWRAAAAREVG
jgi:glutathione S-transferase